MARSALSVWEKNVGARGKDAMVRHGVVRVRAVMGFGLGLLLLSAGGCEPRRCWFRGNGGEPALEQKAPDDLESMRDGVQLELPTDDPKSVLKPLRGGAGTWSSEAREVEHSLGVGP